MAIFYNLVTRCPVTYSGTFGAHLAAFIISSRSHVERELRMTKMENSELQERLHEVLESSVYFIFFIQLMKL